ncbi:MAG: twin-arginine translocase subunit TatC, partial [Acidimicrobiales bacterium]
MTVTADRPEVGEQPPEPNKSDKSSKSKTATTEGGKMSVYEHLTELRNRIIVCIAAVLVGTIVAWFLYDYAARFMLEPYHSFLRHHHARNISKGNLVTSGPLDGFTTRLKISVYG